MDFDLLKYASTSAACFDYTGYGERAGAQVQYVKVATCRPSFEVFESNRLLDELAQLSGDWDGYGAEGISPGIIVSAKEWVGNLSLTLSVLPEISPNTSGTISFEWESPSGIAHLEIGRNGYSCYLTPSFGDSYFLQGGNSRINMDYIGALIGNQLFPSLNLSAPTNTMIDTWSYVIG